MAASLLLGHVIAAVATAWLSIDRNDKPDKKKLEQNSLQCSQLISAYLQLGVQRCASGFLSDKPHKKEDCHTVAWHRTTGTPTTFYLAFVPFWLTYLPLRFWAANTSSNYFRLGVCSSWGQSCPSATPMLNQTTAFTIYDILYRLNL